MNELPQKPEWGDRCNGCGICCLSQQCNWSLEFFGEAQKCPALEYDGTRYLCGLMVKAEQYLDLQKMGSHPVLGDLVRILPGEAVSNGISYFLGLSLGAGRGCDSDAAAWEKEE